MILIFQLKRNMVCVLLSCVPFVFARTLRVFGAQQIIKQENLSADLFWSCGIVKWHDWREQFANEALKCCGVENLCSINFKRTLVVGHFLNYYWVFVINNHVNIIIFECLQIFKIFSSFKLKRKATERYPPINNPSIKPGKPPE